MKKQHFRFALIFLLVLTLVVGFLCIRAWGNTQCVVIVQASTATGGPSYASLGTSEGYDFSQDPYCVGGWNMSSEEGVDEKDICGNDSDLREISGTVESTTTVPSGWSGFGRDFEAGDAEAMWHDDGRSTDLSGADQEFSFCAIFLMEGATEDGQFFGKYNTTGDNRSIKLRYDYSDAAFITVISPSPGTTAYIATGATDVNDGDWHSVCLVYNDIDVRMYVDGEVDSNGANNPLAHTSGLYDSAEEFVFGAINTLGGSPFDGIMLEAMYLSRSMSHYEVQQYHDWGITGDKGGSNLEVICYESFEFMADAEEWDDDGYWSETQATTSVYVADDDVADVPVGSMAGMQVAQATSAEREIRYDFTGPGSGYLTARYLARADSTPTTSYTMLNLADQTTPIINVRVDSGLDYQVYDDTAYADEFTYFDADVWNVMEIEVNLDTSTGVDAYKVWMNGVEAGNSPFTTDSQADPDVIESLRSNQYWLGTSEYSWFDDVIIYKGQRESYPGCPTGTYDMWWDGDFMVNNHACGVSGTVSEPGINTGDGVFGTAYGKYGHIGWRYSNDDYLDWTDRSDFEPFSKSTGTVWIEFRTATGCTTLGDQTILGLYSDSPSTDYMKLHQEVDTPGEMRFYYYQGGTAYRADSSVVVICDGETWQTVGGSWRINAANDIAVTIGNTWDDGTVEQDRDFVAWTTPAPDFARLGVTAGQTIDIDINQVWIDDTWQAACPWCTHLTQEVFEWADGMNLADIGDWSGTSNNIIEISDDQAYEGLTSLRIDNSNTTATYSVEHDFTEVSGGIFTISIMFRTTSITETGTSMYPVMLIENSVGTNILQIGYQADDLVHFNTSKSVLSAASISADTWHKLEVEIDTTNDTMDIYLDDSLVSNDLAFYGAYHPSKITHRDWAGSSSAGHYTYLDNQFIYFGSQRDLCQERTR